MVLKAAERSSNVSVVALTASIDTRISLWILGGRFRLSETSYICRLILMDVFEVFICECCHRLA